MAPNTGNGQKGQAPGERFVLMESPLYWTMKVKERLALLQQAESEEGAGFRQRALTWIRTGIWGGPDKL